MARTPDHTRLKEAILAEAERLLRERRIAYERIEFICAANSTGSHGLVYVHFPRPGSDGVCARTLAVDLPPGRREPPVRAPVRRVLAAAGR